MTPVATITAILTTRPPSRTFIYGSMAAMGSFNYNAAKAAVVMMSKSGALELAAHGIRVVGVAPGFINTPILGKDEAMKSALSKLHMHGQLIEPEKVASVVAFLFTEAAQAINGATVPVDDGFLQFKALTARERAAHHQAERARVRGVASRGLAQQKLAALAARIAEQSGATVDHASMRDFDVPSYNGDVETRRHSRRAQRSCASTPRERRVHRRVARVQRLDAGHAQELDRLDVALPSAALRREHGLLLSASPSMAGGNRGLWALRMPLEHLGARMYPDMFSLARRTKRSTATTSPTPRCGLASRRTCRRSCRSPKRRSTTRASSARGSSFSESRQAPGRIAWTTSSLTPLQHETRP